MLSPENKSKRRLKKSKREHFSKYGTLPFRIMVHCRIIWHQIDLVFWIHEKNFRGYTVPKIHILSSVADPDPGSGAFLAHDGQDPYPGSGMNNPDHIFRV
jgi:hypothetical protein